MTDKFNLVDLLSEQGSEDPASGKRREFYLPLASIPPGMDDISRTINVKKENFELSDLAEQIPSDNHAFIINVKTLPAFAFSDDGVFPDPAIRIHSTTRGTLRFRPEDDEHKNSLILELWGLLFPNNMLPKASWWQRWIDVNCIPKELIYENIDKSTLETVLNSIKEPETDLVSDSVDPTYGLKFPTGVTSVSKTEFISNFLQGKEETFIVAEPGAYIGKLYAKNPSQADDPNSEKNLTLRVYYSDHTLENPHIMNPRELLYLLFGNDSYEASNHPLLQTFNLKSSTQTNLSIEAKRMKLRPPLRTNARIKWEANQEISYHKQSWGKQKSSGEYITIGPERFYNTQPPFYKERYPPPEQEPKRENSNKCNLFVFEICLRSGYRVRVWLDSEIDLFFYKAPAPIYRNEVPGMSLARDIRVSNTYNSKGFAPLANSNGIIWGEEMGKKNS
ncbi:MAG: hypothetical protein ACTSR7_07690 [Promethearchaeota archaeon]